MGASRRASKNLTLIGGIGDPSEEYPRYLAMDGSQAVLWMGRDNSLAGAASITPGKWHLIAATFDGAEFKLYSDGTQVARGKLDLGIVSPVLTLAHPRRWQRRRLAGSILADKSLRSVCGGGS